MKIDYSPNENGGLDMRRSIDSGSNWLVAQTVFSGNIDFYTVVWDSISNTVYLMLQIPSSVLIFLSQDEVRIETTDRMMFSFIYFLRGCNMVETSAIKCISTSTFYEVNKTCGWSWN